MEGLSAYMVSQRLPVESMGVAAPEGRSAHHSESGLSQSLSQGMGQGARQESNQKSNQDSGQPFSAPEPGRATDRGGTDAAGTIGLSRVPATAPSSAPLREVNAGDGNHISVVA
jgi:hypothetical protein